MRPGSSGGDQVADVTVGGGGVPGVSADDASEWMRQEPLRGVSLRPCRRAPHGRPPLGAGCLARGLAPYRPRRSLGSVLAPRRGATGAQGTWLCVGSGRRGTAVSAVCPGSAIGRFATRAAGWTKASVAADEQGEWGVSDTSVGLSYDTAETTVDVRFGVSVEATTIQATIQSAGNPNLVLRPTGNVAEQIVSGVAWPLAQTMASVFSALSGALLSGVTFGVFTVGPATTDVQGRPLTVAPTALRAAAYGDMLLVSGDVTVS